MTDSRLPARMTAVVKTKPLPGREGTQVKSVPVPRPGPGEVLIRVLATAVCGSDRHIYKWDESMATIVKPPRIYGHEFCGEIVRFGPESERQDLRAGLYVSAEMHVTCGHCRPCRTGQRHICENTRILGVHEDGCFAQYVVVPAYNVIPLDDRRAHRQYEERCRPALHVQTSGRDIPRLLAAGVMAAATQLGDVRRLLAVIAAIFAEFAVGRDGAGASRMRTLLIHRALLDRTVS